MIAMMMMIVTAKKSARKLNSMFLSLSFGCCFQWRRMNEEYRHRSTADVFAQFLVNEKGIMPSEQQTCSRPLTDCWGFHSVPGQASTGQFRPIVKEFKVSHCCWIIDTKAQMWCKVLQYFFISFFFYLERLQLDKLAKAKLSNEQENTESERNQRLNT